jgi:AcrR family transcriptional regulator
MREGSDNTRSQTGTPGRTYGGRSAEDRRAERREQLLEAGLERFGTDGFASTSIRAVCAQAGLTERYFYEAFPGGRDDLLIAVYEKVIGEVAQEVTAAVAAAPADPEARSRAGLQAFCGALAGDRRRARVQLIEVVGVNDTLERRRREAMHLFARFIAEGSKEFISHNPDLDADLIAMGLVGAVNELMIDWFLGTIDAPVERIVDNCLALFMAAARA